MREFNFNPLFMLNTNKHYNNTRYLKGNSIDMAKCYTITRLED